MYGNYIEVVRSGAGTLAIYALTFQGKAMVS